MLTIGSLAEDPGKLCTGGEVRNLHTLQQALGELEQFSTAVIAKKGEFCFRGVFHMFQE